MTQARVPGRVLCHFANFATRLAKYFFGLSHYSTKPRAAKRSKFSLFAVTVPGLPEWSFRVSLTTKKTVLVRDQPCRNASFLRATQASQPTVARPSTAS